MTRSAFPYNFLNSSLLIRTHETKDRLMDFKAELAIIEKYVEIKDAGDGDPLIIELITKYFLPQNRFEEARSWRNAIETKELKSEIDLVIKSALKSSKTSPVSRMPQNEDWMEMDLSTAAVESDDQQYHYDRTLAYANSAQSMSNDVEDVRECRNEWITFFMQGAYDGGLGKKGAQMNTLAMAFSDYIELILLPDEFVEMAGEESAALPETSIETAYSYKDPKSFSYLAEQFPSILKELYITNFFCQLGVGGKQEEVVVTNLHIAFLPEKKSGWGAGESNIINVSDISSITVGSEIHTEYRGLTSQTDAYWTLTFNLNNYTQFTRWLFLGRDEKEINQNKPAYGRALDTLGSYFELLEGDSFESTGGYQTSFGVGFWN